MIGQTVRNYRVESKLGAGGMGIVYRAWDQVNGRPAALKVLPPSALENDDRRKRFANEAKVSSGLNHPNIVSVYEVGSETISGQQSDFIAMELIEGVTLDHVIGKTGVDPRRAVRLAIQLADALVAAHSANVIHRDLKPSNIMVLPDDTVKILDFGLAKLSPPLDLDPFGDTQSVQLSMTALGTIVGSVAYMSPEQAEGKDVDARSDIFSLGSVIYEMLSGHVAFTGETKVSQLSAVLAKEPAPLVASVPAELRHIVERCHRKDPARRFQSMADLRAALEDIRDHWASGTMVPAKQVARRNWLIGAGAFAAGLAPSVYLATRNTVAKPKFERLTFRRGEVLRALYAPGGSVYFSAKWQGEKLQVYESQPGNRESRPLSVPGGKLLSVSRKGELAILKDNPEWGKLVRVRPSGGAPRDVLNDVHDAAWGPDDDSFAVIRRVGNRFHVENPIGNVVSTSDHRAQERLVVGPRGAAFFQFDATTGDFDVWFAPPQGTAKILARGIRVVGSLIWSPDNKEIWYSGSRTGGDPALNAVTLEGKERLLIQTPNFLLPQDFSPTGQFLCTEGNSRLSIRVLNGNQGRDFSWLESSYVREFSEDGTSLLFLELASGEGRNAGIFLRKLDGSAEAVRLGFGNRASMSRDAKTVACIRRGEGTSLLLIPVGAGEQRAIAQKGMQYESVEWFPDGNRLLVVGSLNRQPPRSWIQPLDDNGAIPITPEGVRATRLSPDGQSIVAMREGKIVVHRVDQSAPRALASAMPQEWPIRWNAAGNAIYLFHELENAKGLMVDQVEVPSGRRTNLRQIGLPEGATEFLDAVAMTARGDACAFSYQSDTTTLYLVDGLR